MGKHAIVFGASGITGWAIVNELLSDSPEARMFSRVTALTNRPLPLELSLWPSNEKLHVVSGIDLLDGSQTDLEKSLESNVSSVETITQLYFNSYKWSADNDEQSATNSEMLKRAVRAIESLSSKLEFVVLPVGAKTYGVHLLDNFPFRNNLPLRETLPRIPEPHASQLFYYWQVDALQEMSTGKKWTFCEIRPDMVIGFVPNQNAHCLAQIIAIYLSLFVHVHGKGSKVPFPGNERSWAILSNDSGQDIVARFSIYASLHPDQAGGGRAFNVASQATPSTWSEKWPVICSFFGLKGTGPEEHAPQPTEFVQSHKQEWDAYAAQHGLRQGIIDNHLANPGYPHYLMSLFTFNRQLSLDAIRQAGFVDEQDTKTTWFTAFERFRRAKIIA